MTAVIANPAQVGVLVTSQILRIACYLYSCELSSVDLDMNILSLSVVNGMYGTWSLWSECDRTCGGGSRVRSRSCTNPPAQFGGSDCSALGPERETELCNLNGCPGKKVVWH